MYTDKRRLSPNKAVFGTRIKVLGEEKKIGQKKRPPNSPGGESYQTSPSSQGKKGEWGKGRTAFS